MSIVPLTPTDSYYARPHERIASVSLRYYAHIPGAPAEDYYASSEAIGTKLPTLQMPVATRPSDDQCTRNDVGVASDFTIRGDIVYILTTWASLPNVGDFIVARTAALGMIVLGVVTQTLTASTFRVSVDTPGLAFNAAINDQLFYVARAQSAYPLANVYVAHPTWAIADFDSSSGSGGASAVPRIKTDVKAYRRDATYYTLALASSFIGGSLGLTLPCKLEPGWYAFDAQDQDYAEEPANTFTNKDSCPFYLAFERPRYYVDLGRGWAQKSLTCSMPPTIDQTHGTPGEIVDKGSSTLPCNGSVKSDGATLARTVLNLNTRWLLEPSLSLWIDDATGSSDLSADAYHADYQHCIAMAIKRFGDKWHLSELCAKRRWINTYLHLYHAVDAANRGQDYRANIADDCYCVGSGGVQDGDIIQWRNSRTGETFTQRVDTVEEVFRDPFGGANPYWCTLMTLTPFSDPNSGIMKRILDEAWDCYRSPYNALDYYALWTIYDANWQNPVLYRQSVIDDAALRPGEVLDKKDNNLPPGEAYSPKLYVEGGDLWFIELQKGALIGTPVVYLDSGEVMTLATADTMVAPSEPLGVNLLTGQGDEGDKNYLVIYPTQNSRKFYVNAQYVGDQVYMERFVEFDGALYAVEHGTGLWVQYTGGAISTAPVPALREGDTGMTCAPVELTVSGEKRLYAILAGSGMLAQYSVHHSGHIEQFDGAKYSVADALSAICLAMDLVAQVDANAQLTIKRRSDMGQGTPKPVKALLPTPIIESGVRKRKTSIRVDYSGGSAQVGNSRNPQRISIPLIMDYYHALAIATMRQKRNRNTHVRVKVYLDETLTIGDKIQVDFQDTSFTGVLLAISHDLVAQESELTLELML